MTRYPQKTADKIFPETLALVEELHGLEVRCQAIKTELLRRELYALQEISAALTQPGTRGPVSPMPKNEESQRTFTHRLMRLKEILAVLGISRSTWYGGIKAGVYPAPIHLGPRTVAWRASDINLIMKEKNM